MITAKIIADTAAPSGKRITTVQVTLPRFILPQLNKHRAFSNNAQSSRAVPTTKLIESVRNNYAKPIFWGKNQKGMVAELELEAQELYAAKAVWYRQAMSAADAAEQMMNLGAHKEIANRLLEPFLYVDVVLTATEWDNFFNLRLAHDTQRDMQMLAREIASAMGLSFPKQRNVHLPYVSDDEIQKWWFESGGKGYDVDWQQAYEFWADVSAARCARVSYLNHDGTDCDIENDKRLAMYLKDNKHLTPFEHQAVAIDIDDPRQSSGNFEGWKQHRKDFE